MIPAMRARNQPALYGSPVGTVPVPASDGTLGGVLSERDTSASSSLNCRADCWRSAGSFASARNRISSKRGSRSDLVESGEGLCLALEPFGEGGITGEVGAEDLEGNGTGGSAFAGMIDEAHAPGAD